MENEYKIVSIACAYCGKTLYTKVKKQDRGITSVICDACKLLILDKASTGKKTRA